MREPEHLKNTMIPVTSTPPPLTLQVSLLPVADPHNPPFDTPLLLRLRDGQLIAARISRLSPDDPPDRDQHIARAVGNKDVAFEDARFMLYPAWEDNPSRLLDEDFAPYFSDEVTHWGIAKTFFNHRSRLQ